MSYRPDPKTLLRQAAHLRMLVSISQARAVLKRGEQIIARNESGMTSPATAPIAKLLKGELLSRIALKSDGTMFGGDLEDTAAAELVAPEFVRLGSIALRVIDPNPIALAIATGASEKGNERRCMLVQFEQDAGQQEPFTGRYVVLQTGIEGVALTFLVWIAHADVQEAIALSDGPGAERNTDLDALGPNQALLVLELPEEE